MVVEIQKKMQKNIAAWNVVMIKQIDWSVEINR